MHKPVRLEPPEGIITIPAELADRAARLLAGVSDALSTLTDNTEAPAGLDLAAGHLWEAMFGSTSELDEDEYERDVRTVERWATAQENAAMVLRHIADIGGLVVSKRELLAHAARLESEAAAVRFAGHIWPTGLAKRPVEAV